MMFGDKNGGMPGPAMASRMMQMMPMMAGRMLSECSGEDRGEYLTEMVCRMVAQNTEGMEEKDYQNLIDSIGKKLRKREPVSDTPSGCC